MFIFFFSQHQSHCDVYLFNPARARVRVRVTTSIRVKVWINITAKVRVIANERGREF